MVSPLGRGRVAGLNVVVGGVAVVVVESVTSMALEEVRKLSGGGSWPVSLGLAVASNS